LRNMESLQKVKDGGSNIGQIYNKLNGKAFTSHKDVAMTIPLLLDLIMPIDGRSLSVQT